MVDRPIIFSAPMIRALLEERKTQTRRILKLRGIYETHPSGELVPIPRYVPGDRLWVRESWRVSSKWDDTKPRDLPQRVMTVFFEAGGSIANQDGPGDWRPHDWPEADKLPPWAGKLRPSIFLPHWASRLTLIVESVKVERLQDISEDGAVAEGATSRPKCSGFEHLDDGWSMDWSEVGQFSHWANIPLGGPKKSPLTESDVSLPSARTAFGNLWAKLHGQESWDANPWVAAITFRVIKANIDALANRTICEEVTS